jgi:hypothetical protein
LGDRAVLAWVTVAGKELQLDVGGVPTSSLYGRMAEFRVGAGLPPDAIEDVLRTEEGHRVTARPALS